ncbi:MAG TPA: NTP transferase domain-containing protein [Vicinamibacterales bacterium]|nr:NTP transferase domain-containing protein [Vicinamibacterales bacterium]
MSSPSSVPVRDAVILAAGNGDRFKNSPHHSKLLHPVLGQPLILRTLETAAAAGIPTLNVVLGYEADRVRQVIERHPIPGAAVRFTYNPDWHLENGVSALRARELCDGRRFALLMGDHLFESPVLRSLAALDVGAIDSVLAVDRGEVDPAVAEEATKVLLDGDRIVAIGKGLTRWDALDTGLFVFSPALFDALDEAQRAGETTLSAGVQRLAARRLMRGVEIGAATWCDVDTVQDLEIAESLFGATEPEPV